MSCSTSDNTVSVENAGNDVGTYVVPVKIIDHLGRATIQNVGMSVCNCPDGQNCVSPRTNSNTSLGGLAILVMVLSAVLLALLLCKYVFIPFLMYLLLRKK